MATAEHITKNPERVTHKTVRSDSFRERLAHTTVGAILGGPIIGTSLAVIIGIINPEALVLAAATATTTGIAGGLWGLFHKEPKATPTPRQSRIR